MREGREGFLQVDSNSLENIDLIADPAKNFVMIPKDGKIYEKTA